MEDAVKTVKYIVWVVARGGISLWPLRAAIIILTYIS